MRKQSPYVDSIRSILRAGVVNGADYDPRHVEAYMRLEYGTLDSLSIEAFQRSALSMIGRIDIDPRQAESLAQSYGL